MTADIRPKWSPYLVFGAGFLIVMLLSSCLDTSKDVYSTGAFLGTFVGHVIGLEDEIPRGLRVESVLETVSEYEYTFSGEAYLEGVRYTVEGKETSTGRVHYQALPLPSGQITANLTDDEGVVHYALVLRVLYNSTPLDRVFEGHLSDSQGVTVGSVELQIKW